MRINKLNPQHYTILHSPEQLRGTKGATIIRVGTWYLREMEWNQLFVNVGAKVI